MILLVFWRAWFVRNEVIHHKPAPPVEVSVRYLRSFFGSLLAIKHDNGTDPVKGKVYVTMESVVQPVIHMPKPNWAKPKQGWTKLNTDGAFVSCDDAGAGMILRDESGKIIFSACRELRSCRDVLEAELCACMEGLSFAIQRSDLPIVIEMDSMVAISMIQDRELDRSVYSSLVMEIRHLRGLQHTCITHINRTQNKVSDNLASFARVERRTMTWVGSGPPEAVELALADCMNTTFE